VVGLAPLGTETKIDMNSIIPGRVLRGIVEGDAIPDIFIPRLIDLYSQGRFPFDKMITFYPLSDIQKAAEDSERGLALKAVVKP
jgi:aryl-alcohol dehydrogenase